MDRHGDLPVIVPAPAAAPVAGTVAEDGDMRVVKHVYIERRMTPLNLYLQDANDAQREHGEREYGNAIRELAAADIFPGDMSFKNFGVTRLGRVVFYDYDEIQYMTEMNFRRIPLAPNEEAELASARAQSARTAGRHLSL